MKKSGKLAILTCVAVFLIALWTSIGRPRQGRTAKGVALMPIVYLAGHRTAVNWGGNCTDCHAMRITGSPRPATSSSKIHLSILNGVAPKHPSPPKSIVKIKPTKPL